MSGTTIDSNQGDSIVTIWLYSGHYTVSWQEHKYVCKNIRQKSKEELYVWKL